MFEDSFDRFLTTGWHFLFTNFLSILCQVTAVAVSLYYLRKKKYSYLLLIYSSAGLLLMISYVIIPFIFKKGASTIFYIESGNVLFAVAEYVIFSILFLMLLTTRWVNLLIYAGGCCVFLLAGLFYYRYFTGDTSEKAIFGISDFLISFELIALGLLCLVYYFNILRRKVDEKLSEIPAFWIVTGLFPYSLVITPFFMITTDQFRIDHEKIYYLLFIFHFISFSFLFICIIKALLCKKPLTT
jgi:hypothetical protein